MKRTLLLSVLEIKEEPGQAQSGGRWGPPVGHPSAHPAPAAGHPGGRRPGFPGRDESPAGRPEDIPNKKPKVRSESLEI